MRNDTKIDVIDLFAGPGGLGEGFSAYKSRGIGHPFRIAMSVEMDKHAYQTLQLRSFYRQYVTRGTRVPESYYNVLRGAASPSDLASGRYAAKWDTAVQEAIWAELGTSVGNEVVDERIRSQKLNKANRPIVLLGGPPCQAYSLVGRARNKGVSGYRAEDDGRHILYRQYLRILSQTWPVAFVMENVKGILSSKLDGSTLFPRILEDLHEPEGSLSHTSTTSDAKRYRLHTLSVPRDSSLWSTHNEDKPSSFVVRAEEHGVPQRRHRVFVVGIREDIKCNSLPLLDKAEQISMGSVIQNLPFLHPRVSSRSGRTYSDTMKPVQAAREAMPKEVLRSIANDCGQNVAKMCRKALKQPEQIQNEAPSDFHAHDLATLPEEHHRLSGWLRDSRLKGVCNHISKSHMPSDLARYIFAASYAACNGRSPKLEDFPTELLPAHANVSKQKNRNTVFSDRFRVQTRDDPATTITSHLAKDGHYYIHPDPMQMRSLTVREAARIQTFPDNYFFCGPRTAQYQQVGNAVPPYLAYQIAGVLYSALKEANL